MGLYAYYANEAKKGNRTAMSVVSRFWIWFYEHKKVGTLDPRLSELEEAFEEYYADQMAERRLAS